MSRIVEWYDVYDSGGACLVVCGRLVSGEYFMANYGDESIITLYKTERAMYDSYMNEDDDFICNLVPKRKLSKRIYSEIFESEIAKGGEEKEIAESAMREYENVKDDNDLDVWEEYNTKEWSQYK